jgi:putative flippase GtrA
LFSQAQNFARSNRKELKRFLKFSVVGAAGAFTDFTVLNVLVQSLHFLPVVANCFSFTTAVMQNFILNRYWTYPESRQRQASAQLAQFFLVNIIGLGINTLILVSVDHSLRNFWTSLVGNHDTGFFISYNFAKLFAVGIVLFWNFGINRMWTYRGLSTQS